MDKDDLLKVLGIIVLSAVAGYIFLPSLVFNLPFIFIFALIFFPIASAKYNREKMDYSVTGFTVSSTNFGSEIRKRLRIWKVHTKTVCKLLL